MFCRLDYRQMGDEEKEELLRKKLQPEYKLGPWHLPKGGFKLAPMSQAAMTSAAHFKVYLQLLALEAKNGKCSDVLQWNKRDMVKQYDMSNQEIAGNNYDEASGALTKVIFDSLPPDFQMKVSMHLSQGAFELLEAIKIWQTLKCSTDSSRSESQRILSSTLDDWDGDLMTYLDKTEEARRDLQEMGFDTPKQSMAANLMRAIEGVEWAKVTWLKLAKVPAAQLSSVDLESTAQELIINYELEVRLARKSKNLLSGKNFLSPGSHNFAHSNVQQQQQQQQQQRQRQQIFVPRLDMKQLCFWCGEPGGHTVSSCQKKLSGVPQNPKGLDALTAYRKQKGLNRNAPAFISHHSQTAAAAAQAQEAEAEITSMRQELAFYQAKEKSATAAEHEKTRKRAAKDRRRQAHLEKQEASTYAAVAQAAAAKDQDSDEENNLSHAFHNSNDHQEKKQHHYFFPEDFVCAAEAERKHAELEARNEESEMKNELLSREMQEKDAELKNSRMELEQFRFEQRRREMEQKMEPTERLEPKNANCKLQFVLDSTIPTILPSTISPSMPEDNYGPPRSRFKSLGAKTQKSVISLFGTFALILIGLMVTSADFCTATCQEMFWSTVATFQSCTKVTAQFCHTNAKTSLALFVVFVLLLFNICDGPIPGAEGAVVKFGLNQPDTLWKALHEETHKEQERAALEEKLVEEKLWAQSAFFPMECFGDYEATSLATTVKQRIKAHEFIFDTGTTNHVSNLKEHFSELHTFKAELSGQQAGAPSMIKQAGTITLRFEFKGKPTFIELKEVLYQPDGNACLICPAKFLRENNAFFKGNETELIISQQHGIIAAALNCGDIYFLPATVVVTGENITHCMYSVMEDHVRLGHPSWERQKLMYTMVDGAKLPKGELGFCQACAEGKLTRINVNKSRDTPADQYEPGEFLHADMWTFPREVSVLHGYKYFVLIVDDRSRFIWGVSGQKQNSSGH